MTSAIITVEGGHTTEATLQEFDLLNVTSHGFQLHDFAVLDAICWTFDHSKDRTFSFDMSLLWQQS